MRMNLKKLRFALPENPFGNNNKVMAELTQGLKQLSKRAGTNNDKFKAAWSKLFLALQSGKNTDQVLENKLDIRALGLALNSKFAPKIEVTGSTLNKIDTITEKPSSLFLENFFQYYLAYFNNLNEVSSLSSWLVESRKKRKLNKWYDDKLLSQEGPFWVAEQAIKGQKDFDHVVKELELDQFQSGQFMEQAQRIYYVEQLNNIPPNKPDDLLLEVQKPEVFGSRFDSSELLGHKILKILIERAPSHDIHESWLNTIMAIAGDPRIAVSHPRYRKWWSHISASMLSKVKGWLSGLDLKLFLEALEDYSYSSYDPKMKRMFPSRKQFLEGLYDKKLIKNTKLYMCRNMAQFLKRKYREEHLPDFSIVDDGEKSIIYVDLESAHLVEGSHQCQLWIYRTLHDSAPVLQYEKQRKSYRSLTKGLHEAMDKYGQGAYDHFTHSPTNFSWQRRAVKCLRELRVPVSMKDVLVPDDYRSYVRRFGAE